MRRLLSYLRALAVMRAHVVAPDPMDDDLGSLRAELRLERERLAAIRAQEWESARLCFARGLYGAAAHWLIAASSPTGRCRIAEGVDA